LDPSISAFSEIGTYTYCDELYTARLN